MRKFILVDQSIKDFGGHHYEYAMRILDAADKKGFEPHLVTHQAFKKSKSASPYKTYTVFSRTFWENFAGTPKQYGAARKVKKYFRSVRSALRRAALRATVSKTGLLFMRIIDSSKPGAVPPTYFGKKYLSFHSSRLVSVAAATGFHVFTSTGRALGWIWNKWLKPPIGIISSGTAVALSAPLLLLGVLSRSHSKDQDLSRELTKALQKIKPQPEDIIFVPTLHEVELLGIGHALKHKSIASGTVWCLLYRRNIFTGYKADYQYQMESIRDLKNLFEHAKNTIKNVELRFYTDTDELTDQYNRLGIFDFETVPVPCNIDEIDQNDHPDAPLIITYLGDARNEKGYFYFPRLVREMKQKYVAKGRVKFRFQSNFNIPGGEPETAAAKALLQEYEDSGVELIEGPFNSAKYNELLRQAGVILIPYKPQNYAARSSGVFAEAIAAGKPSVITGGTWMARIAEPFRQAYLRDVFIHHTEPSKHAIRFLEKSELELGDVSDRFFDIKTDFTHVILSLKPLPSSSAEFITISFSALDENGLVINSQTQICAVLEEELLIPFAVPNGRTKRIWFRISSFDGAGHYDADGVSITLVQAEKPIPLFFGTVVCEANSSSLSDGVVHIVDHYEHFEKSAKQLSLELRPLVDPCLLVEKLASEPSVVTDKIH